ncbi:MAG TPA: DUF1573 domain-containing protein [Bacteroidales bacterium]|nr:DUF1573 domain-containing protein [Bacteroidales bacterium]HPS18063.1 DUF1573 domain-containing protein [Bacteroidales bacterium]
MRKILFFIICLNSLPLLAQTTDENLKFGDDAFADGDYYSASTYYYSVLSGDTTNIELAYKYAESCRLFNDYRQAEKWYQVVYESKETEKYPLALFYLALMNKNNGEYSTAKNNFYKYYNKNKKEDSYYTQKALHEVESCDFAMKLVKDTVSVLIEHLTENVNTPYSEFGALQLGDTSLVYSALRPNSADEYQDILPNFYLSRIYSSKNTIAGWSKGREFPYIINNKESNNANITYTPIHKKIFFSRCSVDKISDMKCVIYVTEFANGKWQKPVKLDDRINAPGYTSTQPSYSKLDDGREVLYFVSNMPGGYGKYDIWFSVINKGSYNAPLNLGNNINTPGDEISPFYYKEKNTLFFSSDWYNGLGGYDIFKSKGTLNEWEIPENMGFPINTSYNDLYFSVNENDTDGYFTSNRPGSFYIKGETCCNDIWSYEWLNKKKIKKDSVKIVEVKKDTVDYEQNIKDLLPLTLYFHNDIPDPGSRDTFTRLNYKTTLAAYIEMKEIYEKEYSKGLKGTDEAKAINDIQEFFSNYVENGFEKLQKMTDWLLRDLQKGNEVKITVKGFCSPLHTTEYNTKLAKRRISSLKNYFNEYENGIFLKYLNGTSADGGKLIIHEEPVGELQSNKFVSDNPNDERNSIYSRAAALERKIQIIMYESKDSVEKKNILPEIKFVNNSYDFGTVTKGEKKVYSFVFRNTGEASLIIAGVETSCGCTVSDFPKDPILPGESQQINILFDSHDELGIKSETITVYSNAKNSKVELKMNANVVEK